MVFSTGCGEKNNEVETFVDVKSIVESRGIGYFS